MSAEARRLLAAFLLFLYAFGLRVDLLGKHPFHMDEALYAGFSQRMVHGDLLLTGGLNNDKPPLQPYLGALGMALFGENESAVRIMNCLVSAVECAALCWFLWPLAGAILALAAGLLVAGAPLAAGYGASGLMDGPMSLFVLLSFCLAASGRAWGAGLAWGLAAASKQTAWFLLPIPMLATWLGSYAPHTALKRFAKGGIWIMLPVLLWSALFQHPRLGMILLMKANQPEVGQHFAGFGQRLLSWLSLGSTTYQSPWIFVFLLSAGLISSLLLAWRWQKLPELRGWSLAGIVLPACLVLYAGLSMRSFDRYLLPVVSFGALAFVLLLGEATRASQPSRWIFLPLLPLLLWANRGIDLPPTQQGVAFAANDGFDMAAAELKRISPEGGALYSIESGVHWMGNFYLNPKWKLTESQDPEALKGAMALEKQAYILSKPGKLVVAPKGWRIENLGQYGNWSLNRVSGR